MTVKLKNILEEITMLTLGGKSRNSSLCEEVLTLSESFKIGKFDDMSL